MYLSSIPVETGNDPTRIWPGRRWIGNPYRVHQRLCMAFDGTDEKRVLFRIEGPIRTRRGLRPRILVQSTCEPDWDTAFSNAPFLVVGEDIRTKPHDPHYESGQRLHFRLHANPTVKKKRDGKKNGARLGIMSEEGKQAWLARKASDSGFRLVSFDIIPGGLQHARRGKQVKVLEGDGESPQRTAVETPPKMVHLAATFDGILEIADEARFLDALANGVGPAKAYGFGLLSVAPC